ncbi:MAG: hypothetical protein INR69_19660 [Mucilaginibacter polytrichastri]|nr:hypothetical protein [Mucilaginibacter polytrichastri]
MVELFARLLPVLAFIPLGWLVRRYTSMPTAKIDALLVNILLPLMVFYHIQRAAPDELLLYPALTFALSVLMLLPARLAHKTFAGKANPYLLNTAFAFFNIAFFGQPVVKALFDQQKMSALICIYLGSALYGNTIGYYQVARTKDGHSIALKHLLKVPFLYVFFTAMLVKWLKLPIPESAEKVMEPIGWAVSALGMAVVGFNLENVHKKDWHLPYMLRMNGLRTLAATIFMAILLVVVMQFKEIPFRDLQLLILVPLFPVAGNLSVFASYLGTEKEDSALMVLFSALCSLVLVAFVTSLYN